jgi:HlyD family secretion protein
VDLGRPSAPTVLVVQDGRAVVRPVALGLRGDTLIELTRGVGPSDMVIVPRGRGVQAGQRVRPSLRAAR